MIGKALKYMRTEKKLKQEELAKILNIGQTTLSGWEREIRDPNFDMIEKIATICGYNILFENRETKEKFQIKDLARKDI